MYLEQFKPSEDVTEAFGLWKDAGVDGLVYQKQMRDEW
jgi:hypothetical protein